MTHLFVENTDNTLLSQPKEDTATDCLPTMCMDYLLLSINGSRNMNHNFLPPSYRDFVKHSQCLLVDVASTEELLEDSIRGLLLSGSTSHQQHIQKYCQSHIFQPSLASFEKSLSLYQGYRNVGISSNLHSSLSYLNVNISGNLNHCHVYLVFQKSSESVLRWMLHQ